MKSFRKKVNNAWRCYYDSEKKLNNPQALLPSEKEKKLRMNQAKISFYWQKVSLNL